ncbi:alpha/beta hydrolase [Demequina salsinemoris]|uniref:alpha/beta hydrolase n=1 Tax=Demequina salsinemoris TaxID=577470 RepID=UPI00078052A4|nr:alpha/beta hydrolase fold domain-containing protein [Demequina salsinemoris]
MHRTLTRLDVEAPGTDAPLKARLYRASASCERALVWVHGGAFAFGDLDMPEADAVAAWLAERGWAVLSVDYRLAPEPDFEGGRIGFGGHPFPAAHDDVVAAFDWMVEHAEDLGAGRDAVLLGGASAGANLAAGAAVALRDRAREGDDRIVPAGLFLAYPVLHAVMPAARPEAAVAIATTPADARFPAHVIRTMNLNYVAGDESLLTDPRAFAGDGDVAGLPPTLIVDSEADDLRPSGERFAQQLAESGVDTTHRVEAGTVHGHLNRPDEPAFARTLERLLEWSAAR